MASAAIFSSLRKRRSPSFGSFYAPIDLTDLALVQTLMVVSGDLLSSSSDLSTPFQRRNSRSLIRKVKIFVVLFESLQDSSSLPLPSSANLCLKELYILIYRSKVLLDYCSQSSRLWLLLQNSTISGYFHDMNQEVSTLLDVFPLKELDLTVDIREQVELLQKQSRRAKIFIDPKDELLRRKVFFFLDEFENGRRPDPSELRMVFVDRLGIRDARTCRSEIEFLEEQVYNQEEDGDPTTAVLNGFIALVRYCRFLLFEFEEEEDDDEKDSGNWKKLKKTLICQEIGETFLTIPKDFCCPISLDLMRGSDLASVWALTSITDDENTHLSLRSFDGTVRLPGWDGVAFGVQKEMVNKGFHVLLHGRSWWRRDLVVLNLDWASWHLVQTLVDDSQRLSEFFHSA